MNTALYYDAIMVNLDVAHKALNSATELSGLTEVQSASASSGPGRKELRRRPQQAFGA